MRTERSRAGFTLTELLVATAILVIFGGMAVASLRYGSSLWRSCHRRSHGYNVATIIFHQLEDDIGGAKGQFWGRDADAFDTRVKFYVDYDRYFEINYGYPFNPYLGRQRLRFVRGIPDDTVNPRLRHAGDGVSNDDDDGSGLIGDPGDLIDEEYYNLKNDDPAFDDAIDEDLMPLEGMCEVAYLMGLSATDRNVLYRAVLAPIGDAAPPGFIPPADYPGYCLFNDDLADIDNDVFGMPGRIASKAAPLANGILHFEVRCWTQYTTTWDPIAFNRWPVSLLPVDCGPTFTWDSDRLRPGGPPFAMDWGEPGFLDVDDDGDTVFNSADLDYVRDNIFPRSVMVVVVVDPSEEYPDQNPLRLAQPIVAGGMNIPVVGTAPAYNDRWPYILIDDPVSGPEWIEFLRFDPTETGGTFRVAPGGRGQRGTADVNHPIPAGLPLRVKLGYTFSRVFHNPAGKEH